MKYLNKEHLKRYELKPEQLRWTCSPESFNIKSTAEVKPLEEIVSQDKAVKAINRGLEINEKGWNIYAAGLAGTGRTSIVKRVLEELETDEIPEDICYVNNFRDHSKPICLKFPAGKGSEFKSDMENAIEEAKDYITLTVDLGLKEEKNLEKKYKKEYGEIAKETTRNKNSKDEQAKKIDELKVKYTKQADACLANLGQITLSGIKKYILQKREELAKKYIPKADNGLIKALEENEVKIEEYLSMFFENLEEDMINKETNFDTKDTPDKAANMLNIMSLNSNGGDFFKTYAVNLLIDNSKLKKKPIVVETNPTFDNLIGKIEKEVVGIGGYKTDFTMIKPGSLLKANGGYLIINALDILTKPYAYEILKRVLKTGELKIEDIMDEVGYGSGVKSLELDPIKINPKIIMIGEEYVYEFLSYYDGDFKDLFKIKAEFQSRTEKTGKTLDDLAGFTSKIVKEHKLLEFDNTALASLAEYSVKLTDYQKDISLRFGKIKDLIIEASVVAKINDKKEVSKEHVEQAIVDKRNRENFFEERYREFIKRYILLDTEGKKVGEINGLGVYVISDDYEWGVPEKITATTAQGERGVISIDREAKLTGPFVDKGHGILDGYLREKFGQDKELSLTAKLCFEQEYGIIDGDSASSTETYAVLSSLSDIPINQNIAVTGSVNQKGMVQAIGGVSGKIEGFYELCKTRGLTGDQGVMIPESNVQDLMLKQEIIDSVKEGKFHIYAVKTIDEGLEVLTDAKAEEVHNLADKKLKKYCESGKKKK